MNIGFIATIEHTPWGGSERLWSESALELLKNGDNVFVITKKWTLRPKIHKQLEEAGAKFKFFSPKFESYWLIRQIAKWGLKLPLTRSSALDWFKKQSLEVVVISQPGNWDGVDWMKSCAKEGIRYVTLSMAASENTWPSENQLKCFREGITKSKNNYYVAEANWRLSELQIASKINNASIIRTPITVERDQSPEWPSSDGIIKIAFPARFEFHDKGQHLLLEVLAMQKWKNRSLVVNFYGEGIHEKILSELIKYYEIKNAEIVGFRSNVESIWAENNAFILTSKVEGIPISMIDAMMCGRACLVTNAGGNQELIEDGITGWIAPYLSPNSIDEMLEKMWINQDRLKEMGAAAREKILKTIPVNPANNFINNLKKIISS